MPRITSEQDEDARLFCDLALARMPKACNIVPVVAGYRSNLCQMEILSPSASLRANCVGHEKDASIVLFGETGHHDAFLIVGDIGTEAWREMFSDRMTASKLQQVDILILHSASQSWVSFCDAGLMSPKVVVCIDGSVVPSQKTSSVVKLHDGQGVIIEDDDTSVSVYCLDRNDAILRGGDIVKHARCEAWRCLSYSRSR